jgi:hypothetical protein
MTSVEDMNIISILGKCGVNELENLSNEYLITCQKINETNECGKLDVVACKRKKKILEEMFTHLDGSGETIQKLNNLFRTARIRV